VKNINNIAVGN